MKNYVLNGLKTVIVYPGPILKFVGTNNCRHFFQHASRYIEAIHIQKADLNC